MRRLSERGLTASQGRAILIVVALTIVGIALRLRIAGQSLFADEFSTYWIISENGFGGVISTVHTDAEITPPLYFAAAWLATRIELTPELLRAPSILAGVATIPLTYLLALRTAGRAPALITAALTALSPFMIFYSAEARGYAVAIAFVLASTLSMLAALDGGRVRWWVAYGACTCAAVLTHYTSVFALAAQLLWLLWAEPRAWRAALVANAAAVVCFLPWLSGLIADFDSPTTKILSSLTPFDLHAVRVSLGHWAVGYPFSVFAPLRELPGVPALALLVLSVAVAVAGIVARRRDRGSSRLRLDPRLVLIVALALSAPLGEALASLVGTNLLGTRNLAVSWPAFAVALAALLAAAGPRLRYVAAALAITCFAIGAAKMLEARFERLDYDQVATYIEGDPLPRDVVIDGTNLSPAPVTALDLALDRPNRVFYVGKAKVGFPYRPLAAPPPTERVTRRAVDAAGGDRVFVISASAESPVTGEVLTALGADYRRVGVRDFRGLRVLVYARRSRRALRG